MMAAARSKRIFCEALAAAGAVVTDIFVVFDYGTFPTESVLAPGRPRCMPSRTGRTSCKLRVPPAAWTAAAWTNCSASWKTRPDGRETTAASGPAGRNANKNHND
ncbi:hypothetical protein [Cupriavidus sp. D39]|uniref:hypothetical protein n=1 Tax=Cupriavidus sp. D39 TaxID=2997877 RepID=UPI0022701B09|nr:hypothetical protein [Cupriavidus sp. D39]MCY0854484.1 hypothetical protein [Cupriavidus sp. D39]